MNSIVDEKPLTFKDIEQEIFRMICKIGQDFTQEILVSPITEMS